MALLSKWGWKFLEGDNETIWKKLLLARYGHVGPWIAEEEYRRGMKGYSIWWRDLILLGAGTNLENLWFKNVVKEIGQG